MTKKTKIICTIGPASAEVKTLEKMIKKGMDGARLNFSHGTYKEHGKLMEAVRQAAETTETHIPIIQDLSGFKLRIGVITGGSLNIEAEDKLILTTNPVLKTDQTEPVILVNHQDLVKDIKEKDQILIDDGKIRLTVIKKVKDYLIAQVVVGGELKSNKGINIPDARLQIEAITEKDKQDLDFGLNHEVDYVALSYVRSAKDILNLRKIMAEKKKTASIIAKIETREALDNLEEIIKEADGVMVARGDLAVEVPAEEVPLIQKDLVNKCRAYGKPVIIATQMLESMVESPTPTRAEVSDVANAVFDGTDAVMLSGETALGDYPTEAVAIMSRILDKAESKDYQLQGFKNGSDSVNPKEAVTEAVVKIASDIKAKVIISTTYDGSTERLIARHRPSVFTVSGSDDEGVCRRLNLSFGSIPLLIKDDSKSALEQIKDFCLKNEFIKKEDAFIVAQGTGSEESSGLYVEIV
ncbi:MAG: pyruvate kinase [Patescibacteria group bacterium]